MTSLDWDSTVWAWIPKGFDGSLFLPMTPAAAPTFSASPRTLVEN
jgi:hypothetical protein